MSQQLKQVGTFLLTSIVLSGFLLLPLFQTPSYAATITDLQKQKAALEQKLKNDEAARKQKQAEQEKLKGQISDLGDQINGLEFKISETEKRIDQTGQEIDQKTEEIAQKERELARQQSDQAETLRVIYETGNPSTLEVLVGTSSLSEFLTYQEYLNVLQEHIQQSINEISQTKTDLETKKSELVSHQNELGQLRKQQEAYQKALANQRQQKEQLAVNAKAAEGRLTSQIADAQRVYSDVNSELTQLMEAARRRAAEKAQGKIPSGVSNIGIQYPVIYRYLSCLFGCRTPFQSFHTGIDMVNYQGTEVYAAGDGVVTHIGRLSYGYGQYVIVTHNERFATLYAHFQDFADGLAVGQTVSRGQVLGYMGSTGWSTAPHLHFEVREYGIPADPLDYLPK